MSPTPLKLISSMATRELLVELVAQCSQALAQPLIAEAAGGVDVARRVQADEEVDLVVLASNAINKLIAEGKLLTDSRVDLVQSGIAIAVRAGAAHPDISSDGAVKRAVLAANTLSYSTGPSGIYLEQLFTRWGILDEISSRVVVPPPGMAVGTLLARGDSDLGFQQLSELINLPGIEVLGPLPTSIQTMTTFSGGISARCQNPEAARRVLAYLASPTTTAAKRRHGLDAP